MSLSRLKCGWLQARPPDLDSLRIHTSRVLSAHRDTPDEANHLDNHVAEPCGHVRQWERSTKSKEKTMEREEGQTAVDLREGQVWSYVMPTGWTNSYVVIDKIDEHPVLGRIVHISVSHSVPEPPESVEQLLIHVSHLPLREDKVVESVVELLGSTAPYPGYVEGYDMWKGEFDKGRAGIFTITVAETVEACLKPVRPNRTDNTPAKWR